MKKKLIKDGYLTDKGKPNEKTPKEWFAKIGASADAANLSYAKKLKEEITIGGDEEVKDEEAEEVEEVPVEKKKKKKKKDKVKEEEDSD